MKEKLNEVDSIKIYQNSIDPLDQIKRIIKDPDVEQDPFYVVYLDSIFNQHIKWITRLPRVEPHYAMKCNSNPMLLKLLATLGAGFDCASKKEIQTILDLGVSSDRIIYANPCKQTSYLKYAYSKGVDCMTFDNEQELYKIRDNHPNAKLVLRIITNDTNAVCKFSMKFGADMATSYKLIDLALKLGLNLVGISFHVGSGQMSASAFSESIKSAKTLFDYAEKEHNCHMNLLDLGGGFPGAPELAELFTSIAGEINKTLNEVFPEDVYDRNRLKIIAEPGRYYACSAFTLCVNVIAKRVTYDENNEKSIMYYINDGVYSSFNCIFYDHVTEFTPILLSNNISSNSKLVKSSIWGPTCDGIDVVLKNYMMPEIEIGDSMAFKNMGAYTIAGACPFNGIPVAHSIYSASASWQTIKDAFDVSDSNDANMDAIEEALDAYMMTNTCANELINSICNTESAAQMDELGYDEKCVIKC